MPLVPERQYLCEFGQNTYHKVERGEKPFCVLSDPNRNIEEYLAQKADENVGHSFEHIYDDAVHDTREEFHNRHLVPKYRQMQMRRQQYFKRGLNVRGEKVSEECVPQTNVKRKTNETFFPFIQY